MNKTRLEKYKEYSRQSIKELLLNYLKQSPSKFIAKYGDNYEIGLNRKSELMCKEFIAKRKLKRYNKKGNKKYGFYYKHIRS